MLKRSAARLGFSLQLIRLASRVPLSLIPTGLCWGTGVLLWEQIAITCLDLREKTLVDHVTKSTAPVHSLPSRVQ